MDSIAIPERARTLLREAMRRHAASQFDTAIAELSSYTVNVTVTGSNALPGITSTDLFLISVTVSHPENVNFTVSGYRANF